MYIHVLISGVVKKNSYMQILRSYIECIFIVINFINFLVNGQTSEIVHTLQICLCDAFVLHVFSIIILGQEPRPLFTIKNHSPMWRSSQIHFQLQYRTLREMSFW